MSPTLIAAVVTITAAAIFYTVAVFAERKAGVLVPWHLGMFWTGFVFDVTGTTLMSAVAGGWKLNIHGVLGVAAIVVMFVHCVWATIAIVLKQEDVLKRFHRFSLAVWALWMTSLITGYALAVPKMLAKGPG